MKKLQIKSQKFARRKARVRAKVHGTEERPRLSIFKSHKYIYAQIVNDDKGHTLVSAHTMDSKAKSPVERAQELGALLAKKAKESKITKVVFDRGGYIYHGRVRHLAEAARQAGLKF